MNYKEKSRLRRARKTRARIARSGKARLSVFRSGRHIYAQVITPGGGNTLAAASTVQKDLSEGLESTCNIAAAQAVGKKIAEQSLQAGVEDVAFDRSGYKYHGRVKALAEAAREAGLKF